MAHQRTVKRGKKVFPIAGLSLGTVMIGSMLLAVLLTSTLAGAIGAMTIVGEVSKDKQERVNHDLTAVRSQFNRRQQSLAEEFYRAAAALAHSGVNIAVALDEMRQELDLTILNTCDVKGRPLQGNAATAQSVPIETDPVLRQALAGEASSGIMLVSGDRLELEAGSALHSSLVRGISNKETGALFWWFAYPLREEGGEVRGVVYGGRSLNRNFALVDELRELVFGTRSYNGKPFGTVTIFLNDIRVATNVVTADGSRAVGTVVSAEVREQVLGRGEKWLDRAMVVDTWYVSAYEPLRDPDGRIIGMLYVGLLEAPYSDLISGLIVKLLLVILAGSVIAGAAGIIFVRRITLPLRQLSCAVDAIAGGERETRLEQVESYSEINSLTSAFRQMQDSIAGNEQALNLQNAELKQVNDKLARTNRNYMETLGFVTHELKSPLAAIQTMVDTVEITSGEELPEKAREFLSRIKRRSAELQDMVKNYLDLSRVERQELEPRFEEIDLVSVVIEPCEQQILPMFLARNMTLDVEAPERLIINADQEQLRIALGNYLGNAAKYGRPDGSAKLSVSLVESEITLSVWNEGEGFGKEEGEALFRKFSRLKNDNTRTKQGSGLGLFICSEIIKHHGGRVSAESEKGKWARFEFTIPLKQA